MQLESSLWLNIFPPFKELKLTAWYALGMRIPKVRDTMSFYTSVIWTLSSLSQKYPFGVVQK